MQPAKLHSALLAAAVVLLTSPAFAQPAAPPPAALTPQADPHQAALAAVLATVDEELLLENTLRALAAELPKSNPRLGLLERDHPGLSAALVTGIRPTLIPFTNRRTAEFRVKVLDLLRAELTAPEAREMELVFTSPPMRKMMRVLVSQHNQSNVLREAVASGGQITAGSAEADSRATVAAAMAEMTAEDFIELGKLPISAAFKTKLTALGPKLTTLRVEMENAPMEPAEEQAIIAAVVATLQKHITGSR